MLRAVRGPALRGGAGRARLALDAVAVRHAPQGQRAGGELDALAAQAAGERLGAERATELLECLGQRQARRLALAHPRLPHPGGAGGDDPEVQAMLALPAAHALHAVGLPVAHVEIVGDDTYARRQLAQELGAQPQIHIVAQVERHHGGARQVGDEQVLPEERDARAHPGRQRRVTTDVDQLGIDLDADAARAEVAGGGDDHAAVTAAEVEDHVLGGDGGDLEHLEAHGLRCGDEEDVGAGKALAQRGTARHADREHQRQ